MISKFPFAERVCLCFEEAPRLELTVRPVFNYGVDVAEIPGIAHWLVSEYSINFRCAFTQLHNCSASTNVCYLSRIRC